jgi:Cu/Ag efflux protein CusF
MNFEKPSADMVKELKVGDRVKFTFTQVEGGFRIETISKVGDKAMPMERAP